MTKIYVVSDTHFGHKNILNFKYSNGIPIRNFKDIEEHDSAIIENWNSIVNDIDTVYHLGDVALNKKALKKVGLLKGRKILIKGNHDIFPLKEYLPYFEDIRAYKVFSEYKTILSHIPIHPQCMDRWHLNIHGHLHHENLYPDIRYFCASVEQTNYLPIDFEDIKRRALILD